MTMTHRDRALTVCRRADSLSSYEVAACEYIRRIEGVLDGFEHLDARCADARREKLLPVLADAVMMRERPTGETTKFGKLQHDGLYDFWEG